MLDIQVKNLLERVWKKSSTLYFSDLRIVNRTTQPASCSFSAFVNPPAYCLRKIKHPKLEEIQKILVELEVLLKWNMSPRRNLTLKEKLDLHYIVIESTRTN